MSLQDEIFTAMRAAQADPGERVQGAIGRTWLLSLQRALPNGRVEDRTDYHGGRSYCLDCHLPPAEDSPWRYSVRVRISGLGPYATQLFFQVSPLRRWWSGPIRSGRTGFHPAHDEVLDRLRAWYRDKGLREVDVHTQAAPVPDDLAPGQDPDQPLPMHRLLFGG